MEKVPGHLDLRYWKSDLKAGFILSFVCIAFGIGIASVSNFPLQAGLVSAVVAMLVFAGYGGSYIVVCGSAAALAPILAEAVVTLGHGDLSLGYQRTLAVIICTAPIMFWVGYRKKAGSLASFFSHSVTAGLLAAIAVILALGRLSVFTGVTIESKGVAGLVELSSRTAEINPVVLGVTVATLALLVAFSVLRSRWAWSAIIPPQLSVLPFLFLAGLLLPLAPEHKISIPENLLSFHLWPDFDLPVMWAEGVGWDFVRVVVTLAVVDSVETVATILAIDRLDHYRRTSDVNRVVSAMGVANFISGWLGGLSNIPGGAKSSMSVAVGSVTAWASIFGAFFIVIEVILGRQFINLLPQAGIAMVIVFTVSKLLSPAVWRHFWQVGRDQFAVFVTTFGLSVLTNDILIGIVAGVLLQLAIVLMVAIKVAGPQANQRTLRGILELLWGLWDDPAVEICVCPKGNCDVYLRGMWVFCRDFERVLRQVPKDVRKISFHLTDEMVIIDQPTMERLRHYVETQKGELHIDDGLRPIADHRTATIIGMID